MRLFAIFLLLASLAGCALRFPGLYDSRERRRAFNRWRDDPTDANRQSLGETIRQENREVLIVNVASLVGGVASVVMLIRPRRPMPQPPVMS